MAFDVRRFVVLIQFPFYIGCAFGTIGNSTKENEAIVQAIARIVDSQKTPILPVIYYSDDQADSDLGKFTVSTPVDSYEITIDSNSVELGQYYLLIRPDPNRSFLLPKGSLSKRDAIYEYEIGIPKNMHSSDPSVNSDNPVGSNYARTYGISGNFPAGDISSINDSIPTGPVRSQFLYGFPDVPYGVLSHIYGVYNKILLNLSVKRISDGSVKTVYLDLRNLNFQIEASCNIGFPYSKSIAFSIGFRVDGLVSVRPGSTFSLPDQVFQSGNQSVTIGELQNTAWRIETTQTFNSPGQVLVFYSCLFP
ncbi:hypothetical protein LEP1GSC047_4068 [Leptospira inadai serovar Lyme str. 10]|uniref:Uncharacterized protein n=2 Tax=Leptospira inadai serovar Lyme TaxID=293084 RepID=V6HE06_9LEPT|nr:hypothetical protein [Leptospira inadai]EQA37438.1 hypothetical protein LEP1GSC047_4068 [Leptospira inadai serovar Lyme str. 10]PNV73360.1 hypothetical protein BES34_017230 [Leptospira inadai serovar Lyme]